MTYNMKSLLKTSDYYDWTSFQKATNLPRMVEDDTLLITYGFPTVLIMSYDVQLKGHFTFCQNKEIQVLESKVRHHINLASHSVRHRKVKSLGQIANKRMTIQGSDTEY